MKIALLGYGKMGKTIERLAVAAGHEIVLRIGSDNRKVLTEEEIREADVAIEFSRPESAFDNVRLCLLAGVPVVCGTTAWLDRLEEARRLCRDTGGAFFYAANFSIGVNLFFVLNRYLARLMAGQAGYEVSLQEIHHQHKLDAPSGTAIRLAEDLLEVYDRKKGWVNRPTGSPEDLVITSERVGEVPGTHEITYRSAVDTITIRHEAHRREGFAQGALLAAQWLIGKTGCFGMEDLLGLERGSPG